MTLSRFLTLLLLMSVGIAALIVILQFIFPILKPHTVAGMWFIFLFDIISFVMFFIGNKASTSNNKYLFSNLIMAFVFFKMMIAVTILFAYKKVFHPENKYFLVPFFIVYFAFTAFETFFMIKLAYNKKVEQ